jgi:hypothetical protein
MTPDAEMIAHRAKRKKDRSNPPPNKPRSAAVPATIQMALREAMKIESVPAGQFDDLLWLIAHESGGRLDVKNQHSTARGLFQLLSPQYSLNPHGAASFGNAVEECQGGIRYVMARYRSASAARAFWEKHNWY